jgi:thiol-disulfide isomerase/thioredoxin
MKNILFYLALCFGLSTASFANPHFTTLDGHEFYGKDLKGKWLVLEYWASWCDVCMSDLPQLQRIYQEINPQKAKLFLVNYDGLSDRQIHKILDKKHVNIPSLKGDPASLFGMKSVSALPMTMIINPQGKVHKVLYGPEANREILKIVH